MTKILCVEDDPRLLEILAEEIESAGYEVVTAVNGRDGLATVLEQNPNLIISDIRMPEMDGYQFLTTLRLEHPKSAWTPFIFLTALSERPDIVRGKALGADDYLTKPIDFELLLATISARLEQIKRIADLHNQDMVQLYNKLTVVPQDANLDSDGSDLSSVGDRPHSQETQIDETLPLVFAATAEQSDLDQFAALAKIVGFQFEGFTNGMECLDRLKTQVPSVLFVSYRTVGLSGLVLGKNATSLHPKLKTILIVAPELGVIPEADNLAGFAGSMVFPCPENEFGAAFQKWLSA